jgi:hypothetical protein
MLRNIIFLWAIISLSILPLTYAQDKSVAPSGGKSAMAEDKPSIFGTDEADQPVKKEIKRSKRWYPFEKNKKWYQFIGESSTTETAQESYGQERQEQQAPSK